MGFWGAQSPVQDSSSQVQTASCGMQCTHTSHLTSVPGMPRALHIMAGTLTCPPETPNSAFHLKKLLLGEDPWLLPEAVGMAQWQDPRIGITSSHKCFKDV